MPIPLAPIIARAAAAARGLAARGGGFRMRGLFRGWRLSHLVPANEDEEQETQEAPDINLRPPQPYLVTYEKEFAKQLKDYWLLVRKPLGEIVRDEMRMLTRAAMNYTPPFGQKKLAQMNNPNPQPKGTDQQFGTRAVERDIRYVFIPVTELNLWYTSGSFREAWEKRDTDEITRALKDARRFDQKTTAGPDPAHHKAQRSFPRGDVRRKRATWQALLDPNALEAYIRKKQRNVGFARSGWKAAAKAFGTKTSRWEVRRNGPGSAIDSTNVNPSQVYARISNEIPRLQKVGRDLQIIRLALTGRADSLKLKVKATLWEKSKKAKRFTFKTTHKD